MSLPDSIKAILTALALRKPAAQRFVASLPSEIDAAQTAMAELVEIATPDEQLAIYENFTRSMERINGMQSPLPAKAVAVSQLAEAYVVARLGRSRGWKGDVYIHHVNFTTH